MVGEASEKRKKDKFGRDITSLLNFRKKERMKRSS